MSNQKTKKRKKSRESVAKNVAGGVVGMIFDVVIVIVAVMLIYRFSISAYQYGFRLYGEPAMSEAPGREVTVTITDGMDFDGIAKMMYENGLTRDERLFKIQEKLSNYGEDGFVKGTYTLTTAMTPEEIMDVLGGLGGEAQEP